jgi:hypothetical protein
LEPEENGLEREWERREVDMTGRAQEKMRREGTGNRKDVRWSRPEVNRRRRDVKPGGRVVMRSGDASKRLVKRAVANRSATGLSRAGKVKARQEPEKQGRDQE